MSKGMDKTDFKGRLGQAWNRTSRGAALGPQALADLVSADGKGEMNRQTAATWISGSVPKADLLFRLADALRVDSRWLATGDGAMVVQTTTDGLSPPEEDLVARFRDCHPRWQLSITLLSYVATEDQAEVSGDVTAVLARAFGKRPSEIRYVASRRVRAAYGDAPHVKHEVRRVGQISSKVAGGKRVKNS